MEDAQFMGTMAQFASLEQTKELNATMAGLSSSLGMSSAQQFLGMNVVVNDSGTNVSGLVTGITMVKGAPQVTVNGSNYATDKITSITLPTAGNTTSK
jgi:flagellar basal-body rod modification protein FlgD